MKKTLILRLRRAAHNIIIGQYLGGLGRLGGGSAAVRGLLQRSRLPLVRSLLLGGQRLPLLIQRLRRAAAGAQSGRNKLRRSAFKNGRRRVAGGSSRAAHRLEAFGIQVGLLGLEDGLLLLGIQRLPRSEEGMSRKI
jgi:hypothetical protein